MVDFGRALLEEKVNDVGGEQDDDASATIILPFASYPTMQYCVVEHGHHMDIPRAFSTSSFHGVVSSAKHGIL